MRCPDCGYENEGADSFCTKCGADLRRLSENPETVSRAEALYLKSELQRLQGEIDRIREALDASGIYVPPDLPAAPQPAPPPPQSQPGEPPAGQEPTTPSYRPPVSVPATEGAMPVSEWGDIEPAGPGATGSQQPPPGASKPPAQLAWSLSDINWEPIIGGNWLGRIGVLAIIIGVAFFLALAFDNNWINETGRIILGVVTGVAFLGAGEFWRKKYPVYAQALSGAGIGILFVTIFAAYALYELIGIYSGIGALTAVSVTSTVLALRHDAVWLAIIGIIGAFFAPFILGGAGESIGSSARGSVENAYWLLIYIVLVDVGVIALSTFRNWSWFIALALAGSLMTFGLWSGEYMSAPSPLLAEHGRLGAALIAHAGLTGIFLSFVAATTLFQLAWKRSATLVDLSVMMVNAVAYAGISYGLLWEEFRAWMGLFTFSSSLLYAGIAWLAYRRIGITPVDFKNPAREMPLTLAAVGVSFVFLTIAIPIQVGGPWVPAAWTGEALIMMWLAFRRRIPEVRRTSQLVFAAAAVWLTFVDTPIAFEDSITPFLNRYLPVYLVVIAGLAAAAYLLRKNANSLRKDEQYLLPTFVITGLFLLALGTGAQVRDVWLSAALAVEALAVMYGTFRLKVPEAKYAGLAMYFAAAAWLTLVETPGAFQESPAPFLNQFFPVYLVVIAAAWGGAYLLHKNRASLKKSEQDLFNIMALGGLALLAIGTPLQADGPWMTLGWSVEAVAITWVTLRLGLDDLRWSGLAFLGLAAVRAIGYDSVVSDDGYTVFWNTRLIAFGPLIIATAAAAFLWREMTRVKKRKMANEARYVVIGGVVAANLFALWFLSAEVIGAVQADAIVTVSEDDEFNVISLGLTVLWGLYGGLALVAGFIGGWRMVRAGGLVLLAIPVFKLFLFDSFQLESGFRVAAFLALGVILLIGGYLYQRHSETFRELFLPQKQKDVQGSTSYASLASGK